MKFSQRQGITPISKEVQLTSMDNDLRIGLWNVYSEYLLPLFGRTDASDPSLKPFSKLLWINVFKLDVANAPKYFNDLYNWLRNWFLQANPEWFKIYDFIEQSAQIATGMHGEASLAVYYKRSNIILEKEFSAFRFTNGLLAPITNQHEKAEIENALNHTKAFSSLKGCNIHLTYALHFLSDKTNPDYRNSIKESISAIESFVRTVCGKKNASLKEALKILKSTIGLHPVLEIGFNKMYEYTSDEDGVRHAIMEMPTLGAEDARFMLISSSAFINYLIVKAEKAGVSIQ